MSRPAESLEPPPNPAKEIAFRPLLLPACAFLAGIVLGEAFDQMTLLVAVLAGVLVVATPIVYFFSRSRSALFVPLILLCAACGFLRHSWAHATPAADDVSRLVDRSGTNLRVRGLVANRPSIKTILADGVFQYRDATSTRFDLVVDSALTKDGWQPASGKVRVNVYDNVTSLAYGDRVELQGWFAFPKPPTNPGQTDYRLFLEREGIRVQASAKTRAELRVVANHQGNFLLEMANSLGTRLAANLNRYHPPREAGLLRCILLGERSAVDPEVDQDFRLAGISWLLAVSGLHVVILLGGMWAVLRFFLVSERVISWVIILTALGYGAMAAFSPPVMRAVVVMVMFAAGGLFGRRHDMLNSLAAAALILCLINPHEVFFPGFQLSFIAVLGLVAFARPLARFLDARIGFAGLDLLPGAHHWLRLKLNRFFINALAITFVAWLVTQPLVAWHFHLLNPTTVLLNLILVPVFAVILFAAFVALIVETIFGGFVVAAVTSRLTDVLLGFSEAGANLPGSWIVFPAPSEWTLWLCYALVLLVGVAPMMGLRRRGPAIAVAVFFCALVAWPMMPQRPRAVELAVLDVGQGSATVVRSTDGRAALIDVGTMGSRDVSRTIVIPYLAQSGVRTLDAVVLTHADTDHTNGLPALVDNFRVRKVLLCETFRYTRAGLAVERWLIEKGVPHEFFGAGDSLDLGDVRLTALHPPRVDGLDWSMMEWLPGTRLKHPHPSWSENERSLVVRGVTANGTFLVFGDAAGKGMKQLAGREDLSADVIVAPHHGGTSGGENYDAKYRWPVVLISASGKFVKSERLVTYHEAGSTTLITAETGTCTARFGPKVTVDRFLTGEALPSEDEGDENSGEEVVQESAAE